MIDKKNGTVLLVFIILAIIWGSNFIYTKIASPYLSALQLVLARTLFGLLPVGIFALFNKSLKFSHLKHWPHLLMMGILASSAYYYCFAKGIYLLPSGVAGIISGAIPLFSFVLSRIFLPSEKITKFKIVGVLLGFGGIFLIAKPWENATDASVEGVLYMMLGSLSIGASFVYAKKYLAGLQIPSSALAFYQLMVGFILLAALNEYDNILSIMQDWHALLGLVLGLGLLGTGVAFIAYYWLIKRMGAIAASSATYAPPVVAFLIGVFIANEPLFIIDVVAAGLILLGVFMLKD